MEADSKGNTLLHFAAKQGNVASIKALAAPDTVNRRNADGETPVLIAFKNERIEAGLALIRLGANIDIKDRAGKSARDYMPD